MDETYYALIQRYKLARYASDSETAEILYRTIQAVLAYHWHGDIRVKHSH